MLLRFSAYCYYSGAKIHNYTAVLVNSSQLLIFSKMP